MIKKIVTYTINKKDVFAVNIAINAFLKSIQKNEKDTKYRVFRSEDQVTFFHYMNFVSEQAEDKHKKAAYTKEFVKVLYPLCIQGPVFTTVKEII